MDLFEKFTKETKKKTKKMKKEMWNEKKTHLTVMNSVH